ncbi:MAG TPA: cytochrome P450 [Acidimicrobiales bacterium]|nr:cytochrome P450 [Acidimicrobiales bacterium]
MTDVSDEIYYDPYDFDIDADPYPVWRRMREEQPLYYNDKYDFFALTRFDDVEKVMVDWETYRSGRGSVLDAIKLGIPIAPGNILMEDPPDHDVHRSLVSRVFTPKRMAAIEPEIRAFCTETLDPHVGTGGFDFVADLGAYMPMRTIGMLLGIPEEHQTGLRELIDEAMEITDGYSFESIKLNLDVLSGEPFAEYVEWREQHPSDDLMTDLLNVEFEDDTGTTRKLRRDEILGYLGLIASAGNETTTRLISWTGKLLAEHPDQRATLVEDPSLIRGAIEEILRYEAPSPVQARYVSRGVEWYDTPVPEGAVMVILNGAANRDDRKFENGDSFDITRKIDHHLSFGYGIHFCLGAALARLEGRVALEEVLKRFPAWDVDWDNAQQAHTTTVRGWRRLPVFTG